MPRNSSADDADHGRRGRAAVPFETSTIELKISPSATQPVATYAAGVLDPKQVRSAIIASTLGWSLNLFDLFVLLYVAPVVGALFFPSTHPTLSLAAVSRPSQ